MLPALLKLVRFPNLLIIAFTQIIAALCIPGPVSHHLDSRFWLVFAGTLMTAAAGYVINDYLDIRIDLINKPEKVVIGKSVSRRAALLFHSLLNFLSLVAGLLVSPVIAFNFLVCAVVLWLYSEKLKKSFLLGNITIGLLTGWTVGILYLYNREYNWKFILAYSLFAFLTNVIREIVKDAEDIRGDRSENSQTLPIVSGIRQTRHFSMVLVVCLAGMLTFYSLISWPMLQGPARFLFFPYIFLLILIPLAIVVFLLLKADVKVDFTRISRLIKLIMVAGILSMLFLYR